MSTIATRVLRRAAGEIGYSRWTDKQRGTKYARETQPALWPKDTWLLANGISYCDIFVTWVFWKEGLLHILPAGASYNTDYRASKGGRIDKSKAQPGDILVFDWNWSTKSTNHVGILEKVTKAGNPQSIEGNTSPGSTGSQSNGGGVHRRVRKWSQVRYVLRPDWSKADAGKPAKPAVIEKLTAKAPWETSPRVRAMSKSDVKDVQTLLKACGYSLGAYGIDGSYGRDTYNAVLEAQKDLGAMVDGIAGPATIKALQRVSTKPTQKAPAFPLPRTKGRLYFYGLGKEMTAVTGTMRNRDVPHDVVQVNGRWKSKGLAQFQARLIERGWGELKKDGPDGRFGSTMHKVTGQFQEAMGLPVDHKIGPATWAAAWTKPVK